MPVYAGKQIRLKEDKSTSRTLVVHVNICKRNFNKSGFAEMHVTQHLRT